MSYSAASTRSRPWWVRVARAAPLLIVLLEVLVVIGLARLIGWWTLPALLAVSLLGLLVIARTSRRSWRELRARSAQASRQGSTRPGSAGSPSAPRASDSAINLAAGGLLLFPGFVTGALGLVLLVPATHGVVRRTAKALTARGVLRASGVRVYGSAGRSVFGDVVPGAVQTDAGGGVRRPGQPRPPDPPVIEGRIVDD